MDVTKFVEDHRLTKVADVEPKSCELLEIYLPETLFQRTTHRLNNSLYRIRSLPRPCLKFRHLDGLFRRRNATDNTVPPVAPEKPRRRSIEFDGNLNV